MTENSTRRRLLTVLAAATSAVAGCSSGPTPTASRAPTDGTTTTAATTESTTATETRTDAETETETERQTETDAGESVDLEGVPVGEVVRGDAIAASVRAVERRDEYALYTAQDGTTFLVVDVTVKNESDEFVEFSAIRRVQVTDGVDEFSPGTATPRGPRLGGLLAPGGVLRGDVVVQVPVDREPLFLQYDLGAFDGFYDDPPTVDLGARADTVTDLEPELEGPTHDPGATVSHAGTAVTVHGARRPGSYAGSEAEDGRTFVVVDVEIANAADAELTALVDDAVRVERSDGAAYDHDAVVGTVDFEDVDFLLSLDPGERVRGEFAFQVPADVDALSFSYSFTRTDSPSKAFWTLN
ncbi:DUF4352 domain-containing protein [Halorubellus sp. PRR65]|uniref:DUF4352 domain-containing protein n=1 Tax=Halorubellus sp. PRR65 TaxID=3098148 RepID=UPI002B257803|nr:DUF4352 domain-containing protein [Halorubellus sp. PRR65]